ncbi:transglycosylase SLT domain-containing protein [Aliiroseovarius sediminis]|uniref:lytic transglycosylase domain-containing protein n=1 Tax=Aliiroseovarius sediminis TaxID=2925839 RepID=UPI001F56B818|nr:transglycosylase SLT domain-containing protein [Aliiroseovarius sediminis]MCI2392977.1 transglycosylase SLT domain-containing protein [Aliiroseovarius sediminis]
MTLATGGQARADTTPAPFPDFTFKRVTVPPAGAKRITIQIDPAEQAAALAPKTPAAKTPQKAAAVIPMPQSTEWDWFWTTVSPKLDKAGPANVRAALDLLETQEGMSQPRLQHLQSIAQAHGPAILKATIGTPVSPALVLALISVESGGRVDVKSHAGAQGLMQLIPDTATRFGVKDSTDPTQNIKGGVAYLNWLINHFQGDPILALAGYNAGENAVRDNGGVPPYAETRAYVPKVLAAWRVARGLCLTPPELLSDGCVFAVNGS